jgi:hypothetical protein
MITHFHFHKNVTFDVLLYLSRASALIYVSFMFDVCVFLYVFEWADGSSDNLEPLLILF